MGTTRQLATWEGGENKITREINFKLVYFVVHWNAKTSTSVKELCCDFDNFRML